MFKLVGELNSAETGAGYFDELVDENHLDFDYAAFDRQTDEEVLDIAVAYYNLAELQSKLGHFKKSAVFFRRAFELYRRRKPDAMPTELWLLRRARDCYGSNA